MYQPTKSEEPKILGNSAPGIVSALLREPMKVALGLAKVTDLDLDLPIGRGDAEEPAEAVDPDASAKLTLTKLGQPTEFAWSDFARVDAHPDATAAEK